MSDYEAFLRGKLALELPTGIAEPGEISEKLFPFQRDCVRWALRRGRAALFEDTGLGKTRQQLEWARIVAAHTGKPVIVLSPLAVAAQTLREAGEIGIQSVVLAEDQSEIGAASIVVTNYDRLHLFDASKFSGVVCDESGILKDFTSATRNQLIETFAATAFKLCCTATPSPNDYTELGNHAEFLGILTRAEMLGMWFAHDGGSAQDWRVKGHAEAQFWAWVCGWGLMVKRPSDLGYEDGAYDLPPLEIFEHVVPGDVMAALATGQLIVTQATTLHGQRRARKGSLGQRVALAAKIIAAEPDEQWLAWCELNAEADALTDIVPGAEQVAGSDDRPIKARRLLGFCDGSPKHLITKPSIGAWGLNYQHSARQVFVGVSHSFEQWYQCIRREWRFGQKRPVHVHIVVSEAEGAVLANLKRKQADAEKMAEAMRKHTLAIVQQASNSTVRHGTEYRPTVQMRIPAWLK